jgi:hypothetical protein
MLMAPATRWLAPFLVDHPDFARIVLTPCRMDAPLIRVCAPGSFANPPHRAALIAHPAWLMRAAYLSAGTCVFLDVRIGGGRR